MSLDNLNVGIVGGAPYIYSTAINGKNIFSGVLYEIWETIAKKNNMKCHYTYLGNNDFTQLIIENSNKYDVIIGDISQNSERATHINFTKTIKINKINILKKTKIHTFEFLKRFLKGLVKPLSVLLLIGLVLGICLHFVDPERSIVMDDAGDIFKHGVRRPILSTIASMFGEMGNVSERSNLSYKSIILVIIIMIVSYYTSIYLQALTLGDLINYHKNSIVDIKSLSKINILTVKGNELGNILENTDINIKTLKNIKDVVEFYKKNSHKYDGIVLDYDELVQIKRKNKDFEIDPYIFGYDSLHFCVNKNNEHLLKKIDEVILYMHDNLLIRDICKKFKHINSHSCIV